MTHPTALLAAMAASLTLLAACGERNETASAPPPPTVMAGPAPVTAGADDPSVPPATSAFPPAQAASASTADAGQDTPANRPGDAVTAQEESTAMPQPGQANTHSSPSTGPQR